MTAARRARRTAEPLALVQRLLYQFLEEVLHKATDMELMATSRLRISPSLVHILLTLVPGPRHGYAMLQDIGERTQGRVMLGPSSLYWSLGRLEDAGLIEESAPPEDDTSQDERRRYWGLTVEGRERLKRELESLEDILSHAHARELMSRGR